jgi:hypothetical protein
VVADSVSGHDHGIAGARCLAATMAAIIWLPLLAPLVLGWGTQRLVTREFARYRSIPNHAGATGAQVARALLDAHGLSDVRIETAPGALTDNYDGKGGRHHTPRDLHVVRRRVSA